MKDRPSDLPVAWIVTLIAFIVLAAGLVFEEALDGWLGRPGAHRPLLLIGVGFCLAGVAAGLRQRSALTGVVRRLYEEKLAFFTQVSHQFRTPLTSIVAYSELLLDKMPAEGEERHWLGILRAEGLHLTSLVQQLSLLARIDAQRAVGGLQLVDLRQTVQRALDALQPLAGQRGISLVGALGPDDFEIAGDALQLHHLVTNLLDNAIKYNRPQGHVRITLRREPDWLVLGVSDTGIGIPEADLPRIFEPFYRDPGPEVQTRPGSGLGLSIVRRAVEWHGGEITVRSSPQGTSFTVRLPDNQVAPAPQSARRLLRPTVRRVLSRSRPPLEALDRS